MAGGETKQRINDLEYENAILRETVARLSVKPTLRDRFAMAALTGLLANEKFVKKCLEEGGAMNNWFEKNAYEFADAMMEARDGK